MMVGPSSRTSASTSRRKPFSSAVGWSGSIDAAIDAAAEMLDEGAEQARIGVADGEIPVDQNVGFPHGLLSGALELVR